MKKVVLQLFDEITGRADSITISEQDLSVTKKEAGRRPWSPFIVKLFRQKFTDRGFQPNVDVSELYRLAKGLLLDDWEKISVNGRYESQPKPAVLEITPAPRSGFFLAPYHDSTLDLQHLVNKIVADGPAPFLWINGQGLMNFLPSGLFAKVRDEEMGDLISPVDILRFLIRKTNEPASYILEDFHYYLGTSDAVQPSVGEIRTLIKQLHRTIAGTETTIYFFVPNSYTPSSELRLLFKTIPGWPHRSLNYLDRHGCLMSASEYLDRTKPTIGVDSYISRLAQVLCQMEANNSLLVGPPGVGKTAIVEGLARAIFTGQVAARLKGKSLYALSLNSLIAGTRYRGDLESRLEGLIKEVLDRKTELIIFIDEIHTLLDSGSTEGSMGAGDILKPVLARGEFPCIGATTLEGADYFAKDAALARRFKKILVKEPSSEEALVIMRGLAPSFEKYHGLTINDEALTAAVEFSARYITDGYLPGKAVALLDGAAAYASLNGKTHLGKKEILMEIERTYS
ncbi:MAG: ATP-dependent Clp protease ATP-binding subunit [Deltaproteobacteria bacterium]|nr:ATP-dependent Clp protease ATP-binding subunit [Deltaproteobacteria bacterium]